MITSNINLNINVEINSKLYYTEQTWDSKQYKQVKLTHRWFINIYSLRVIGLHRWQKFLTPWSNQLGKMFIIVNRFAQAQSLMSAPVNN